MDDRDRSVAPRLWAANQALLARREAHRAGTEAGPPAALAAEAVRRLPAHLGWGSAALTRAVRAPASAAGDAGDSIPHQPTNPPAHQLTSPPAHQPTIRHHPSLGLALLRRNLAAPGRLWLLLRHLDGDGRGWVTVEEARERLTRKGAPLRFCGWRQLRNLLRQGQGTFWERDGERIWLRSTLKVAATLRVERLAGRPVDLPLVTLLGGMKAFRAALYAAFHSGRASSEAQARGDRPIARRTLARITGVSRRAQQAYEALAGVDVRANYAVGGPATPEAREEAAWKRGGALFELDDTRGLQGRQGRTYLAWQLPNSYRGPHARSGRGRQKHLNRRLADLRQRRDAGNDQGTPRRFQRRYCHDGASAARVAGQGPGREAYWPCRTGRRAGPAGSTGWHVLSAEE